MAKKEVFFQVLWFSCRQIRWGRRPKWNFHLDNLASPWYFFNVAVRCSTGWITFCFRWELVVPYSPFCMWGCEVTALDFVTEICNTAKQISKALVGEVILISMSRFGKVHFIQTLPLIYVECFLCSAYCVHSLLLRQICIQACHIHWNKYNVFYDFCCCAIGWSCLIHPDIIVLPTSVSLWRCKMVEFNTDFLFLTKPFVLVTMGDALLSWEFTTTVVVPLLAFLRFLSVSCFNPLHTKGGGVYFTQK